MGLEIITRPLDRWPREFTQGRKSRPFKTAFQATLRKLRHELAELGTTTAVLQVAVAEPEISVTTGFPRGDRRPSHPGIILAADTKHGPLKWVCDDCADWTDNLHAIALTLERLRLADRYGVSGRGEQYSGWKMLPGPITAGGGTTTMSIEDAARFVVGQAGVRSPYHSLLNSRESYEANYRRAARKLHPDAGGDPYLWTKLQDAKRILDNLHMRK